MDMWPPYIYSTLRQVPGARDKIVFDRYHIMSYMNEAVDDVRKREHREYRAKGEQTPAGSRFLWLYAQERLPQKHQQRFAQLRALNLKTGRAWAIKESASSGRSLPAGLVVLGFVLSLTLPRLLVPQNRGVSALTSEAL